MCAAGGLRPLSLGGMAILKNATTPLLPGSRKGATFFIHTQSPQNQQIVQGSGSWVTERCKIKIADVGWLNWSLKKKRGGGGDKIPKFLCCIHIERLPPGGPRRYCSLPDSLLLRAIDLSSLSW